MSITKNDIDIFLDNASNPDFSKIEEISKVAVAENKIPKIIHFCYVNYKQMDDVYYQILSSWIEHLSDYVFINWTPKILSFNSYTESAIKNKKWAFYADYIRVYGTYLYGGFYLDCDVIVYKTFNDILDLPYIFDIEYTGLIDKYDTRPRFEAGVFGTQKENILMRSVCNFYDSLNKDCYNFYEYIAPFLWNNVAKNNNIELVYSAYNNLDDYREYFKNNHNDNRIISLDSTFLSKTNMRLPHRFINGYRNNLMDIVSDEHAYTSHQLLSNWIE